MDTVTRGWGDEDEDGEEVFFTPLLNKIRLRLATVVAILFLLFIFTQLNYSVRMMKQKSVRLRTTCALIIIEKYKKKEIVYIDIFGKWKGAYVYASHEVISPPSP
jgi:hypothetical protein